MAKSRGRKFAELVAPTNGVFAAASIPTLAISKLASSAVTINSESLSLGGSLTLDTSDIGEHTSNKYFTDTRAQATLSVASNSGHGALAYDNSNGEFTFAGITTEAIQDVVGAMFSSNTETAVTVTYQDSDGTIDLIVDDTTKVPLAGGTMTGNLTLGDNVNAYFGASTDLRIYHDGTNSHIINSTGELRVTGSNIAIKSDSAKLYLGASDDLQIYHDGSHSFISDQGTGHLKLLAGDFRLNNAADNAQMISAVSGGSVYLYDNNSLKLQTSSTGISVSGHIDLDDNNMLKIGTGNDFEIYFNGTHGVIRTASSSVTGNIYIQDDNNIVLGSIGGENYLNAAKDGAVTLYYDNSAKLATTSTGVQTTGTLNVNGAFAFPTSDGSANQILQTNGSGTLSWVTNSGGSSVWTQSGSDIYYTSGEVGIGNSSPNADLHIGTGTNTAVTVGSQANPALQIGGTTNYRLGMYTDAETGYIENRNGDDGISFRVKTAGEAMVIDGGTGNVGIGTDNPGLPLTLQSGENKTMLINRTASNEPANLNEFSSYYSLGIVNRNSGSYLNFGGGSAGTKIQATDGAGSATAKYITLNPYGGYVGIGTGNTAPATPLHINSTADQKIILSGSNDPYIRWQEGSTNKGYLQWNAAGYFELRNQEKTSYWTLGDAFAVYPTTDEAFVIQRSGSALRQKIYNTSTTGTYSYLQLTTVNSSSTQNSGYIIKNAAQGTGNSLGNDSLYLWNQTNEVELVPAGTIGKRTTLDTSGDLTVRGAGAANATGIVGEAYSGYFGLRQIGQSKGSEYMILSDDTHTYISATSGYNVIIRNGGNNSTNQLVIGNSATALSWRGNTVWTAENDGGGSGLDADLLDGQEGAVYFKGYSNVSGWQNSNQNFSVRGGGTGAVGLHMEKSNGAFGFQLYGDGSYYGFLDGEWASWDVRKTTNGILEVDEGSGMVRVLTSPENNIESSYFNRGTNVYGVFPGVSGQNLNTVFTTTTNRAGFLDAWGGTNFPTGMSHIQGLQVRHNSGSHYGIQLVGQYNVNGDLRMRNVSNGSFTGWYKIWTDNNDGSGSGLDADTVDGLNVHNTQGTQNSANTIVRTQVNGYTMLGWINTTSGDSGLANDITRIYCSNDSYIRYLGKSDFKVLIGNSGQTTYDRRDYTSSSLYHTGANSHNDINYNQLFERGCGFNDNWSSGTGKPPTGSHYNGFTATHYANGSSYFHGMQLAMSAGNPAYTYLRGWWANGGSGYNWQRIWTDGNDGSGSGLDADLLDGLNAKGVGSATGASQVLTSNTNSYFYHHNWIDIGGAGIYSSTTNGAHFYPNTQTSYATWRTAGGRNGYDGILFDGGGDVAVMWDTAGNGGFYQQGGFGWSQYYHVGNSCTGLGSSTTSSSYEIYVSGAIYATGNIVAYSDRRVKENIVPIDNALEKVNKLAGVYYNRIEDEKKTREIGFIAQDVNEVTPELVTYAEDVDQYGVKYGNTTALLVEAVKELTQQVKDLKQELEELKNG